MNNLKYYRHEHILAHKISSHYYIVKRYLQIYRDIYFANSKITDIEDILSYEICVTFNIWTKYQIQRNIETFYLSWMIRILPYEDFNLKIDEQPS